MKNCKILCACGCGALIDKYWFGRGFKSDVRERKYVSGHNKPWLGKKRSKKTIEKIRKAKIGNKCHWKGGKTMDKDGYIDVLSKDHPSKRINNYVKEHRLVMEKHLGRKLKRKEVVHHIDGDRTNNYISNLMLFPNNSAHLKYHWVLKNNE